MQVRSSSPSLLGKRIMTVNIIAVIIMLLVMLRRPAQQVVSAHVKGGVLPSPLLM